MSSHRSNPRKIATRSPSSSIAMSSKTWSGIAATSTPAATTSSINAWYSSSARIDSFTNAPRPMARFPRTPRLRWSLMLAAMVEIRVPLSIVLSSSAGLLLLKHFPFAEQNDVLQLILLHKPLILAAIKYLYLAMSHLTR